MSAFLMCAEASESPENGQRARAGPTVYINPTVNPKLVGAAFSPAGSVGASKLRLEVSTGHPHPHPPEYIWISHRPNGGMQPRRGRYPQRPAKNPQKPYGTRHWSFPTLVGASVPTRVSNAHCAEFAKRHRGNP